jgi:phytoene desaturase
MSKNVIVIGAGIGGLSCAIRLQNAGYRVKILEKNPIVGGKMYELSQGGYRWDTGPSVITMRHVFEDLFASANRKLEDYLTFLPIDPLTRYFYPDGKVLDATRDFSSMAQTIAELNERDVEGYFNYLAYAARIHRITGPVFIYDKPPTPASFAKVPITEWLSADPFRTMNQSIQGFVKSPHLRQLLGRFATYVGGSPYLAPATLNVIAHVELTGGVWYPQGGIYQISRALEKLALELGVEIYTNTPVEQICVQGGRITEVVTRSGKTFTTQIVVANSDVTTTVNNLLPKNALPPAKLKRLSEYAPSCSGFIMLLGVKKQFAQLVHHNIFFSKDYEAEFKDIFQNLVPHSDPTIYVSITSKKDSIHAPEGCENWFVMVNAPALSEKFQWENQLSSYRELVLKRLANFGIDVTPHIEQEIILTPNHLQDMSGAWRGALYGPSANSKWTAFLRPHNRSQDIKGLYFVGGTTHPGGGVPMVTLSGKVAADYVIADHA